MSRIGRLPIKIEDGVTVTVDNDIVTVKGKLGTLSRTIENANIKVSVEDGQIHVTRENELKATKAAHGLYRALIHNMVEGVTKGYTKVLLLTGVGYKAQMSGQELVMNIGYSHPIKMTAPEGIKFDCPELKELKVDIDKELAQKTVAVRVSGIDKELVGQTAANVKALRKPEPYHGYGIRYSDETILRKEGKTNGK